MSVKKGTFNSYVELKQLIMPIWQRNIENDRINKIVKSFENSKYSIVIPEIIVGSLNNLLIIIDGQHRVEAVKKYYESTHLMIPLDYKIIYVKNENELKDRFRIYNQNTTLPPDILIDPDKSDENKNLYKQIQNFLSKSPCDFLTDGKCDGRQRPKLFITDFLDQLFIWNDEKTIFTNLDSFKKFFTNLAKFCETFFSNKVNLSKYKVTDIIAIKKCKCPDHCIIKYIGYFEHKNYTKCFKIYSENSDY